MTVAKNAPYSAVQSSFIKTMQEHSLEQMVNQHTRILNLFLLIQPNNKHTVNILPSLSDHDIVCIDIQVQPEIIKQKPREVYLHHGDARIWI